MIEKIPQEFIDRAGEFKPEASNNFDKFYHADKDFEQICTYLERIGAGVGAFRFIKSEFTKNWEDTDVQEMLGVVYMAEKFGDKTGEKTITMKNISCSDLTRKYHNDPSLIAAEIMPMVIFDFDTAIFPCGSEVPSDRNSEEYKRFIINNIRFKEDLYAVLRAMIESNIKLAFVSTKYSKEFIQDSLEIFLGAEYTTYFSNKIITGNNQKLHHIGVFLNDVTSSPEVQGAVTKVYFVGGDEIECHSARERNATALSVSKATNKYLQRLNNELCLNLKIDDNLLPVEAQEYLNSLAGGDYRLITIFEGQDKLNEALVKKFESDADRIKEINKLFHSISEFRQSFDEISKISNDGRRFDNLIKILAKQDAKGQKYILDKIKKINLDLFLQFCLRIMEIHKITPHSSVEQLPCPYYSLCMLVQTDYLIPNLHEEKYFETLVSFINNLKAYSIDWNAIFPKVLFENKFDEYIKQSLIAKLSTKVTFKLFSNLSNYLNNNNFSTDYETALREFYAVLEGKLDEVGINVIDFEKFCQFMWPSDGGNLLNDNLFDLSGKLIYEENESISEAIVLLNNFFEPNTHAKKFRLFLDNNYITGLTAKEIITFLMNNKVHITELSLEGLRFESTEVADSFFRGIGEFADGNILLTKLWIDESLPMVTADGTITQGLKDVLAKSNITTLGLHGFSDDNHMAIARSLEDAKKLKELVLEGNFSEESLENFAKAINKQLNELVIFNNTLTGSAVMSFLNALSEREIKVANIILNFKGLSINELVKISSVITNLSPSKQLASITLLLTTSNDIIKASWEHPNWKINLDKPYTQEVTHTLEMPITGEEVTSSIPNNHFEAITIISSMGYKGYQKSGEFKDKLNGIIEELTITDKHIDTLKTINQILDNLFLIREHLNDYVKAYQNHALKAGITIFHKHGKAGRFRAETHFNEWQLDFSAMDTFIERIKEELTGSNLDALPEKFLMEKYRRAIKEFSNKAEEYIHSTKEGGNLHEHSYKTYLLAYKLELDNINTNHTTKTKVEFSNVETYRKQAFEVIEKELNDSWCAPVPLR